MITTAGFHEAIAAAWDAHGLEGVFNQYWTAAQRAEYPALHEQEAVPTAPMPYCIFEQEPGDVSVRMTGYGQYARQEINVIAFTLKVYARTLTGSGKSAKAIASELIDELMARFGGHPTATPIELTMDHGQVINMQYVNDYSLRLGDDEYAWVLAYNAYLDVPVAA